MRPRALGLVLAASACAGSPGTARTPAQPGPPTRETLLDQAARGIWSGDLGSAHVALATLSDREVGVRDPALDFWSELLALLRCQPLEAVPRRARSLDDPWDQLRRLVQIERVRLHRQPAGEEGARKIDLPPLPAPRLAVSWAAEAEQWSDEVPRPRAPIDHCRAAAPDGDPTVAREPPARAPELPLVAETAASLPANHPARPVLLLDEAVLRIARGDSAAAALPTSKARAGRLAPGEQASLALAAALAADATARGVEGGERAVSAIRAAAAQDLPRAARRHLAFRLGERLREIGRADDAVAAFDLPPHGDDAIGRYVAFRQAEAHARSGRRAEVIAEARAALGRATAANVDADAALAAIRDLAIGTLLASPVSAETLEVVEALGVPAERLQRTERFADAAGAAGVHASALAGFLWLSENDRSATRRLHHLARATVAAARAGDRREFARTLGVLAGDQDDDAGPMLIASARAEGARKRRRAARSADWRQALLVVARDSVPALVSADDQESLRTLVETLQRHLTDNGRGPVDDELTTVYRAASAHLHTGARSYAERVGDARRPILLGDVTVARERAVPVPVSAAYPPEPVCLVFVPRSGASAAPADLRRLPATPGVAWRGTQ